MFKKMLFISAIVGISSLAIAQKPVKGNIGFTFGITGINVIALNTVPSGTGTLLFKYHFADDMAARAGIMYGSSSTTDKSDTAGGQLTTTITKSNNWAISLGAQKSFGSSAKLVPFLGADISFGGTGGNKDTKDEVLTANGGTVGDTKDVKETDINSGFNWGLTPVVGFDYFFTEHFAVGAEFGYKFGMSSTKGTATTGTSKTTTITGTTFGTAGETKTGDASTSSTTSFGTTGKACISVSVYF